MSEPMDDENRARTTGLTRDESQRVIDAMKRVWGDDRPCAMCDATDWLLVGKTQIRLADPPGELLMRASTLPSAVLVCKHCGNTVFINMIVLGVAPSVHSPPEGSEGLKDG